MELTCCKKYALAFEEWMWKKGFQKPCLSKWELHKKITFYFVLFALTHFSNKHPLLGKPCPIIFYYHFQLLSGFVFNNDNGVLVSTSEYNLGSQGSNPGHGKKKRPPITINFVIHLFSFQKVQRCKKHYKNMKLSKYEHTDKSVLKIDY